MPGRATTIELYFRRLVDGPFWTVATALVITLVLIGGVLPAAYGYGLPHDHFVLGGSLTIESDAHEHENPIAVVFGGVGSTDDSNQVAPASTGRSTLVRTDGTVVSVFGGASSIILSAVGTAAMPVSLDRLVRNPIVGTVVWAAFRLTHQTSQSPTPPPPRGLAFARSTSLALIPGNDRSH